MKDEGGFQKHQTWNTKVKNDVFDVKEMPTKKVAKNVLSRRDSDNRVPPGIVSEESKSIGIITTIYH